MSQRRHYLALAVAMGREMDGVVVDSEDTARACIRHLKDQRLPPLTFIPLATCKVCAYTAGYDGRTDRRPGGRTDGTPAHIRADFTPLSSLTFSLLTVPRERLTVPRERLSMPRERLTVLPGGGVVLVVLVLLLLRSVRVGRWEAHALYATGIARCTIASQQKRIAEQHNRAPRSLPHPTPPPYLRLANDPPPPPCRHHFPLPRTLQVKPLNERLRQLGGTARLAIDLISFEPHLEAAFVYALGEYIDM